MIGLLLKLLGVHIDQAKRLVSASIHGAGGGESLWVLIPVGILLVIAVLWMYGRTSKQVPLAKRLGLAALRALFLFLLLLMLWRPILSVTVEGSLRPMLAIFFDNSKSMALEDHRIEENDLKRSGLALGDLDAKKGLDQPLDRSLVGRLEKNQRMKLVKAAFNNDQLNLIKRLQKDYDLKLFAFDATGKKAEPTALPDERAATPSAPAAPADANQPDKERPKDEQEEEARLHKLIDAIEPTAPATALGDAVRGMLVQTRGQSTAGIVMMTDGGQNSGGSAVGAAEQARNEGAPLYIWGVGGAKPNDIIVSDVTTNPPETCFLKDDVDVIVRVRNQGYEGQTAQLVLKLDDQEVASKTITYPAAGEQKVRLKFRPPKVGDFNLLAHIDPREDELSKDNNDAGKAIKVVDKKIKVLYIEQSPRWEFKYLMALLMRDRRVEFKTVLMEGDPSLSLPKDSPYLKQIPANEKDLFQFDLIILGEVDPARFTDAQFDSIHKFVSELGGSVMCIAGHKYMPWGYSGTKLGDLLPIDVSADAVARPGHAADAPIEPANQPIHLELTAQGRDDAMFRLADQDPVNVQIWAGLPPIWWDAHVYRAKPGTIVYLVDPNPAWQNHDGKMPVVAKKGLGKGQVMFIGTDNTWRWRKNKGDQFYTAWWGQVIQALSLPHLLGETARKTQIKIDRHDLQLGEKQRVYVDAYDDQYKPLDTPELKIFYAKGEGAPLAVMAKLQADQPGTYMVDFVPQEAGNYNTWAERNPAGKVPFTVVNPKNETSDSTAMDEDLLREMAQTSGGQFFREEDLYKLPDAIRAKAEKIPSTFEVELWSTWIYFLILLAVVTAEWIIRKVLQMK